MLLYAGGMPLALAGAAALAMRTAGQSVANTIYEINRLYEASFHLDLYRSCLADATRRSRAQATGLLAGDPVEITLTDVSFRYPGQERAGGRRRQLHAPPRAR